ncbi:hypothetical protein DID78_05815 [Candidatus Marinamargulisbacteria bacterium SCGC AG-343-D04]|nr:hypothetical protein DID78_05815 [Candidatus Marinamargulisbacteria bacterium SCGC AG-343-D04]
MKGIYANTFEKIPIKYELATRYSGVSSWIKEGPHLVKTSIHVSPKHSYPFIQYRFKNIAHIHLGALVNHSSKEDTIQHIFSRPGLYGKVSTYPIQIDSYVYKDLQGLIIDYKGSGVSLFKYTETLQAVSAIINFSIPSYKTEFKIKSTQFTYNASKEGQGLTATLSTLIMITNNPHRFTLGIREYTWKSSIKTDSLYRPYDVLYSFYESSFLKQFSTNKLTYFNYQTETHIEKTRVLFTHNHYLNVPLYFSKISLEYPLHYNVGILLQIFNSSGNSKTGIDLRVIMKN